MKPIHTSKNTSNKHHIYKNLTLGTPRSGTTRIHKLLAKQFSIDFGVSVFNQEFFNVNHYREIEFGKRYELVTTDTSGAFSSLKCLYEQLVFLSDDEIKNLFDLYDQIVVCNRENICEQALSYAIAHNLAMSGTQRWNLSHGEFGNDSLHEMDLNEKDVMMFFKHYSAKERIEKLIPKNKVKTLVYEDSLKMTVQDLFNFANVKSDICEDEVVKLNSFGSKLHIIKNMPEVLEWIKAHMEKVDNDKN
jgi:hypothetical protein